MLACSLKVLENSSVILGNYVGSSAMVGSVDCEGSDCAVHGVQLRRALFLEMLYSAFIEILGN